MKDSEKQKLFIMECKELETQKSAILNLIDHSNYICDNYCASYETKKEIEYEMKYFYQMLHKVNNGILLNYDECNNLRSTAKFIYKLAI